MPATSQMNNATPNKFRPYGGAINKSLLTPCRRVGLSRKRNTPNSILKLPSENSSSCISSPLSSESTPVINKNDRRRSKMNFDSPLRVNGTPAKDENCKVSSSLSLKSTPVNIKNNTNKRESKMNFDSPMKVAEVESKNQNNKNVAGSPTSDSKTKKSLSVANPVNDLSVMVTKEQILVPTTLMESENELEESVLATPIDIEHKNEKTPLHSKKRAIAPVRDDSSSNDSVVMLKSKKSRVLYDSDEDFLPSKSYKPKLKRTKSETPIAKKSGLKVISKMNSENMIDNLKNCKITLHKLSEDEIVSIEGHSKFVLNDFSDDEVVAKVKKKKIIVLSDDDFESSQKTATPLREDNFIKDSKNLDTKKTDNILEDEEDAFTSTPDRDKNEKRDLIERITTLEKQNKEKRKLLDTLKQASVYQSIHNIEDLEKLTQKYKEGCVNGLKELLSKLQAHGPIDMNTLLINLRISSDMITRLSMSDGN